MSSEALEKLELKVTYLERANTELSDVVYRQEREIEELRRRLAALAARVAALLAEPGAASAEQERPPHY